MEPKGVWWINSDQDEAWAGLRIAAFFTHGDTEFVIIQNETPDRVGVREWAFVQKNEGFFKVQQLVPPLKFEVEAARQAHQAGQQHDGEG